MKTVESKESWKTVLDELNSELRNNDRKHDEHRDDMDTTIVDRQPKENEIIPGAKMLKLSSDKDWIDMIYSRKPEDLQELVTDEAISKAIKGLTLPQKEVLFWNVIYCFKTSEIAAARGVSERNIRKIRQRALKNIHKVLDAVENQKGEATVDVAVTILITCIFVDFLPWPFFIGWLVSNRIYPKLKAKVLAAHC